MATAPAIAIPTAPDRIIVGASIRDEDITGLGDTELGTVANAAGLCRTAAANHIGEIGCSRIIGCAGWLSAGAFTACCKALRAALRIL